MKNFLKSLFIGAIMLMSTSVWASSPSTPAEKEKRTSGVQDVQQIKCMVTLKPCDGEAINIGVLTDDPDCIKVYQAVIEYQTAINNGCH